MTVTKDFERTKEKAGVGAQAFADGGAGVMGLGMRLPQRVLTNGDLEALVDTSDEWIMQRTGISERRIVAKGETTADIAVAAAKGALADACVEGRQIGLVIVATATADYYSPAIASVVQHAIGADQCAAFDLNAGCSGSVYALVMANSYIMCGACDYALVIGAETLSRFVDWGDRRTCILFGDGAGAAVLGRTPSGYGLLSSLLRSDGEGANLITIPGLTITDEDLERRGGVKSSTIWMDGGKVMKFASRAMHTAVSEVVSGAGLDMSDVSLVIPHQANLRIIENAARHLDLDESRIFVNLNRYGNTSAASILIALLEAARGGRLNDGDYLVLVAFGAGLTYGAALLRWINY